MTKRMKGIIESVYVFVYPLDVSANFGINTGISWFCTSYSPTHYTSYNPPITTNLNMEGSAAITLKHYNQGDLKLS